MESLCQRIAGHLEALARERAGGAISEERFVELVLKLEEQEATPAGFSLTASNTYDNWTVFKLRLTGTSDPCAAFEFLPETGEFRRPGSICR